MTNSTSRFNSPATIGFILAILIIFCYRMTIIGTLYLLALVQEVAPVIVKFVKTQLGDSIPSPKISYFEDSLLDEGCVATIRKESMIELANSDLDLDISDLIGSECSLLDLIGSEGEPTPIKVPVKKKKSKLDRLLDEGCVATIRKESTSLESSPKVVKQPRKYLTKKEKQSEQNWIDRSVNTDWQDKDVWLTP
jgi:hypothetical protein